MSAANPKQVPNTNTAILDILYADKDQFGLDKYVNTVVTKGMIVIIPSVSPIQNRLIATGSLEADKAFPIYNAIQYREDDKTVPAGTITKNAVTPES
jgi:hypothetical protein